MSETCLNCGHTATLTFCPSCGQKTAAKRITFFSLLHDIPHSVLHIDKGFFYTFIQLLKRPGDMIREYLSGKRVNHYKPLAYLIILSTVGSFVSHIKDSYMEANGVVIVMNPNVLYASLAGFFGKYPSLMFLLFTPVISLWTFLFNRNSGYNYTEHLVLNIYLISQFNIFLVLNDLYLMSVMKPGGSMVLMLTVFFTYMAFVYIRFFKGALSGMKLLLRIIMYLVIVITVLTGLSVCGLMTRWWW